MSSPNILTIQEVEHENLLLTKEVITLYKNRIAELEDRVAQLNAEIVNLKALLNQTPVPFNPPPIKRLIKTTSELRTLLEARSAKVMGVPNDI